MSADRFPWSLQVMPGAAGALADDYILAGTWQTFENGECCA
jgi:hypothetical protein